MPEPQGPRRRRPTGASAAARPGGPSRRRPPDAAVQEDMAPVRRKKKKKKVTSRPLGEDGEPLRDSGRRASPDGAGPPRKKKKKKKKTARRPDAENLDQEPVRRKKKKRTAQRSDTETFDAPPIRRKKKKRTARRPEPEAFDDDGLDLPDFDDDGFDVPDFDVPDLDDDGFDDVPVRRRKKKASGPVSGRARLPASGRRPGTRGPASGRRPPTSKSGRSKRPGRNGEREFGVNEYDMPEAPRQKGSKGIWTICIIITVLCVGASGYLIWGHYKNKPAENGGGVEASPEVTAFLSYLQRGDVDDPAVTETDFADILTDELKEALRGGKQNMQLPDAKQPREFDEYVAKTLKSTHMKSHDLLNELGTVWSDAKQAVRSSDDEVLDKAAMSLVEFAAKAKVLEKLIEHLPESEDPTVMSVRATELRTLTAWLKEGRDTMHPKTNRLLGEARLRIFAKEGSETYRKYKTAHAIFGFYNNDYPYEYDDPLAEMKKHDVETFEFLKDSLKPFVEEMTTQYQDTNSAYVQWLKDEATNQKETDEAEWEKYITRLKEVITVYEPFVKALETVATKAGIHNNDAVNKRLERYQAKLDQYNAQLKASE